MISGVREQFPGHVSGLPGDAEAHRDVARFGRELVPGDGDEPVVIGSDVAMVAGDGRVCAVYGFLDKVPDG